MKTMNNYSSLCLAFTFILTSCNGGNSSSPSAKAIQTPGPVTIQLDSEIEGQYLGVLKTINPTIQDKVAGAFTFSRTIEDDELIGDVRVVNSGSKIIHMQNVRTGSRCPDLSDDKNNDGIIDAQEAEQVFLG